MFTRRWQRDQGNAAMWSRFRVRLTYNTNLAAADFKDIQLTQNV